MADNVPIDTGSGAIVATDEIGGVSYQRVKPIIGNDGVNDGDVSATNPMPTRAYNILGITATGNATKANSLPVTIASDDTLPDTASGDLAEISAAIHAEDSPFSNADKGIPAMVVRNNTATPTASNGDYVTLQSDASGKLWVNSEVTDLIGITSTGSATQANSIPVTVSSEDVFTSPSRYVVASQSGVSNAGDLLFNSTGVSSAYAAIQSGDLGFATFAAGSGYLALPMAGYNSVSFGIYQNTTAVLRVNVYTRLFESTGGGSLGANYKLIATATVDSTDSIQFINARANDSSLETFYLPQVAAYQYIFEIVTESGTPSSGGATVFVSRTAGGSNTDQYTQARIQDAIEAVQLEVEDRTVGKTPLGTMQRLASIGTATSFVANANATAAKIQAQAQAIYFTLDGTTASATNGFLLAAGASDVVPVSGAVAISVIEAASGGVAVLQYVE